MLAEIAASNFDLFKIGKRQYDGATDHWHCSKHSHHVTRFGTAELAHRPQHPAILHSSFEGHRELDLAA
jgi:hypothetical protein